MSTNRITISVFIGEDEIEYTCQYLKHNEGVNRLYHSVFHLEYNENDSSMDIASLKNHLAKVQNNESFKAKIIVDYLDLNKTIYIQGSVYAFKSISTAGSFVTKYILYLSHETRPLTLSHYSGVNYQAKAKDIIERRLLKQTQKLNLSDYTEFFEKVNYNTEARFPTHPMLVQWKQSTYTFLDRVLGTHGLWYQLYSHKSGVDFVIGDNNLVFSGHSDDIKNADDKGFYFDDEITISIQNKQNPEAAYQYQRMYNGSPIADVPIEPEGSYSFNSKSSIFDDNPYVAKHYIDYEALKRKLSDKRSQQQNHQQLASRLQRTAQQHHKNYSTLSTQQRRQSVANSHPDYISYRHLDTAKKKSTQAQQALEQHQMGKTSLEDEIKHLTAQVKEFESRYKALGKDSDRNYLQYASFRQFENIRFYHSNQATPGQSLTELLPLAITDDDKALDPYFIQSYSLPGESYFPVMNREEFEAMAKTQQEQMVWNNSPRFVSSFQGYVLRAGTIIKASLNRGDEFPKADKNQFQDYDEYLVTDVIYEYTAEKNQQGQSKTDALGRVVHYQEKHTVMGSYPKCDYRPFVNYRKQVGRATHLTGVKPYQISPASFEVVPNQYGYVPICLPLDYQENVGSSCYYAPRLTSGNTDKMNQSHPFYPDTELMVSFINGNPEMPFIRGALANKATGHVNSQNQDKRMMLSSPQGHMFSNTLNAGDDNTATLKTRHGFQNERDGEHQTYVSLSNVGSTIEEGKKQLDITEATTANRTIKTGNKFEQFSGVTNNDTTKANYGLVIDPNIEEPEPTVVDTLISEVKDRAVSAAKVVDYATSAFQVFDNKLKDRIKETKDVQAVCQSGLVFKFECNKYKQYSPPFRIPSGKRCIDFKYDASNPVTEVQTLQLISGSEKDQIETVTIRSIESSCMLAKCLQKVRHPQVVVAHDDGISSELILPGLSAEIEVPSKSLEMESPGITVSSQAKSIVSFGKFLKDVVVSRPEPNVFSLTPQACGIHSDMPWVRVESYPDTHWDLNVSFGYIKGTEEEEGKKFKATLSEEDVGDKEAYEKIKDNINAEIEDEKTGWLLSSEFKASAVRNNQHIEVKREVKDFMSGLQEFLSQLLPFLSMNTRYLKTDFKLPNLSIKGDGKLIENPTEPTVDREYDLTIKADPLIGASGTIDLLAMLCDYFGMPYLIDLRNSARKAKTDGKVGAKATVELNLIIDGKIGGTCSYSSNPENLKKLEKNCFDGGITFTIEGKALGEVRFFIVKGKAGLVLGAWAKFGAQVRPYTDEQQRKCIDGQFYFDGLIIYYMAYASLESASSDDSDKKKWKKAIPKTGRGAAVKAEKSAKSSGNMTILEPRKWPEDPKTIVLDEFNG